MVIFVLSGRQKRSLQGFLLDAQFLTSKPQEYRGSVDPQTVTSPGRMAAHTGQEITCDQILNSDHEMAPSPDKLTENSPTQLWKIVEKLSAFYFISSFPQIDTKNPTATTVTTVKMIP